MQRCRPPGSHPEKPPTMRRLIFFLLATVAIFSCKKETDIGDGYIYGEVKDIKGCFPASRLVMIENPNPKKHSFLCETNVPLSVYGNCTNSVYLELPADLAHDGQKIKFKVVSADRFSCLSYTMAAAHVRAENIEAR